MKSDFGIVIPHLDYSAHLHHTLLSIIGQEGDFSVHIHIQDGGKHSDARNILDRATGGADLGRFYTSLVNEPDINAADAINKGMENVEADVVTWLGADDLLLPGSLQAVYSLRHRFPHLRWITGLPFAINQFGVSIPSYGPAGSLRFPSGYSRSALRLGLISDGKNHGTIQQEGTFWERALWEEVGGLDTNFSLAFDFDLWCRFAEKTDLTEAVLPLAAFRKRPGQASENVKRYAQERRQIQERQAKKHIPRKQLLVESVTLAFLDSQSSDWRLTSHRFVVWVTGTHIPSLRIPSRLSVVFRVAAWLMSKSRTIPPFRRLVSWVSERRRPQ